MKKLFLLLPIIFVAIIAFALFVNRDSKENGADKEQEISEDTKNEKNTDLNNGELLPKTVAVSYTNSGYSPTIVNISTGDTIIFVNSSSFNMWTASAAHPTHTVYPGSNIKKCDTVEEEQIFDACRVIASGASWSFTFTEVGTWSYHNHLQPSYGGTVIVK